MHTPTIRPVSRSLRARAALAWAALPLLGLAFLAPVPLAATECAPGGRVSHTDAECLSAGVTGVAPIGGPWTWRATNHCADLGPVAVATGDGAGTVSVLATLGDGTTQTKTWTETVHLAGVYCCQDLSAACNRSDITPERCVARLDESAAAPRCESVTAAVTSTQECVLSAICTRGDTPSVSRETTLTVSWSGVPDVTVCDTGELWEGPCP